MGSFKSFWEAPVRSILIITKHEVDLQSLIHDKFAIALVNNDLVTVGRTETHFSQTWWIYEVGNYQR